MFEALKSGADIITCPGDVIDRMDFIGASLQEESLNFVKMFHQNGIEGFIKFNG